MTDPLEYQKLFPNHSLALWWKAIAKANNMAQRVFYNTDGDLQAVFRTQRCKTYTCTGILDDDSIVFCKVCRDSMDEGGS